jgi:hypothetical protein
MNLRSACAGGLLVGIDLNGAAGILPATIEQKQSWNAPMSFLLCLQCAWQQLFPFGSLVGRF